MKRQISHREEIARGIVRKYRPVYFVGTEPKLGVLAYTVEKTDGLVIEYYRRIGDPDPMLVIDMAEASSEYDRDECARLEQVLLSLCPLPLEQVLDRCTPLAGMGDGR